MITDFPWSVHRYTGPGTATEANARYRGLVAGGTTALSVAFDLPTQLGHDSDAPIAAGEVGRAGVAVDSLDDMRVLFAGIPLEGVSTSLAANAPAAVLLLLYQLVAEEQGVRADRLTGTVHNDVLTEYLAPGRCLFPPEASLRLTADLFAYCRAHLPEWNMLSVSGVPLAQAGASPAQEVAFTLAAGIEYLRTALALGMDPDDFTARLSFVYGARTSFLEEAATVRAACRIWSRVLRERYGVRYPARPDPLAGGRDVAAAADEVEAGALELMGRVEELGGALAAVVRGFQRDEIARNAHRALPDGGGPQPRLRPDPATGRRQAERLAKLRAWRCADRVHDALTALRTAAGGRDNVLYPMKRALACGATLGEVCDTLRQVWGTYGPAATP
ncbi:methylmalonyl-CoA mutase family protein [Streptomyces sp. NPDC001480]|uniref:methylmalonyl-CoA mutase family protein n=1 Tax=Streptomyces sp. NPDC001480 TaxID=3364577 RepID=UPI0036B84E28